MPHWTGQPSCDTTCFPPSSYVNEDGEAGRAEESHIAIQGEVAYSRSATERILSTPVRFWIAVYDWEPVTQVSKPDESRS